MAKPDLNAAILKHYGELQEQTGITGPVVGTISVAPGKFAVLKYPLTLAEALQAFHELGKPAKKNFFPKQFAKKLAEMQIELETKSK